MLRPLLMRLGGAEDPEKVPHTRLAPRIFEPQHRLRKVRFDVLNPLGGHLKRGSEGHTREKMMTRRTCTLYVRQGLEIERADGPVPCM